MSDTCPKCGYDKQDVRDISEGTLADINKEEHLTKLSKLLDEPELYQLVKDLEKTKGISS